MSKLAELRKSADLTQAELAVFVGVTPNTIQAWEGNGSQVMIRFLKLCIVLGCELKDLIDLPVGPMPGELLSVADLEERFRR